MVNFLAFLIIAIPVFAFINFIDIERTRRRIRRKLEAENERDDGLMELFGDMKDERYEKLKTLFDKWYKEAREAEKKEEAGKPKGCCRFLISVQLK